MRNVIESYAGIWVICILFIIGLAFTCINLNVTQARKIYNDVKSEVQASNGAIVPSSGRYYYSSATDTTNKYSLQGNGYQYEYSIIRKSVGTDNMRSADETYIYNDLYQISLKYEYYVPLFGKQVYPITGYAY